MKILKEIDFPLLNRKRYSIEIEHQGKSTPKKNDLKNEISGFLKKDQNLVAIRHLYSRFGEAKTKAIVHVYEKQEAFDKFEEKKVKNVKEKVKEPKAK